MELTGRDRRLLERWVLGRDVPRRVAERALLVLAFADGHSRREVAARHRTSAHRVGRWLRRYAQEGPEGLLDRPRRGRPPIVGERRLRMVQRRLRKGRVTSTYQLARTLGVSQPTASRVLHQLRLAPAPEPMPPRVHPSPSTEGLTPVATFVRGPHRVIVLGEDDGTPPTVDPSRLTLAVTDARRRPVSAGEALPLRRFLRDLVRACPGRLVAIATTRGPLRPAVRRLLGKHHLVWCPVATEHAWRKLALSWAVFGQRPEIVERLAGWRAESQRAGP